jgi:hypothetical protein
MTLNDQLRDAGRPTISGGDVPTGLNARYGYTREELSKITDDASTCPDGDTLYPFHDWGEAVGELRGGEDFGGIRGWSCADIVLCRACGLAGVDLQESGHKTLEDAIDDLRGEL